ncbi:MAG: type pantothenate kinase [Bacillota bacterium]|nr:type pantothenate kinase [Bacillota bacterium]
MRSVILAIDIGNSNMTIGLFSLQGTLKFRATLKTVKDSTRDQCAIDLLNVFRLYDEDISGVSGTIISSVVPPMTTNVTRAVKFLTGQLPLIVGSGIKTGINILGEAHGQLGADIVASSVAALNKYPSPMIVIDMGGTATTMSLLNSNTFEGCVIIPGLRIGVEALSQRAAELPHISIEPPTSVLGRNTIDAMRSGVIYGHAAMLDNMIARMEEASQPAATVIMTGENAVIVRKYCKRDIVFDANLLLDGLYLLYQKNVQRYRK